MNQHNKSLKGLPFQEINRLLNLSLMGDSVYVSDKSLAHIYQRHPLEADYCITSLPDIIAAPEYIGQSPRHPDNFVLVKERRASLILAAISIAADAYGDLPLLSAYLIDRNILHRRLRKGMFKRL